MYIFDKCTIVDHPSPKLFIFKMYRQSSLRILPRGHDRNMTTTAAFMSSLLQQRRNVIQRQRSNRDGCRRRCRRYHSSHHSATSNTAEYQNFSHHALTIASAPPSALPPRQQQQHDDNDSPNQSSLVFGQTFTPHMLQIHYQNGQWSAPQIVPYQNLSLSPAASSLHYGACVRACLLYGCMLYSDMCVLCTNTTSLLLSYYRYTLYRFTMLRRNEGLQTVATTTAIARIHRSHYRRNTLVSSGQKYATIVPQYGTTEYAGISV